MSAQAPQSSGLRDQIIPLQQDHGPVGRDPEVRDCGRTVAGPVEQIDLGRAAPGVGGDSGP